MEKPLPNHVEIQRLMRRAERLRARVLRLYIAQAWRRFRRALRWRRAEAELRALDERELHDLALGRGGIADAARHGRHPG